MRGAPLVVGSILVVLLVMCIFAGVQRGMTVTPGLLGNVPACSTGVCGVPLVIGKVP